MSGIICSECGSPWRSLTGWRGHPSGYYACTNPDCEEYSDPDSERRS